MKTEQPRSEQDGKSMRALVDNAHANVQTPRNPPSSLYGGIHTLPDVKKQALIERTVMCTGPSSSEVGERSSGRSFPGIADGMTVDEAAQRPTLTGVAFAPPGNDPQPTDAGFSDHRVAEFDGEIIMDDEMHLDDEARYFARIDAEQRHRDIDSEDSKRIEQAQRLLELLAKKRVKRGDPKPSESTLTQYETWHQRIDRWPDPSVELSARVSHYASKASTFNLIKAALKHRCLSEIKTLLDQYAAFLADGDTRACSETIARLQRETHDFVVLTDLDRSKALAISQTKAQQKQGKLFDLRYMPTDWRQQFLKLNEASDTYRVVGALMCFTGLRPEELSKGIKVAVQRDTVRISISGAKVTSRSGQPERSFSVRSAVLPKWLIQELIENPQDIYRAPKGAMRAHLGRISNGITGRKKMPNGKLPNLSAYCFRHALVTDLRESGWDDAQIAGVIGERCADTVKHNYGEFVPQGGDRRKKYSAIVKDDVETSFEIKPPKRDAKTFKEFKASQAAKSAAGKNAKPKS